jgi:steroid delta-isomerase-like uncharacterized protein
MTTEAMDALDIARQYFDGWNRRDSAAVLTTLHADGTYEDPMTGGPVSGNAFAGYMQGLFSAFPDLSFEVVGEGMPEPDRVSAQWIMRGTNLGSMNGLPPTGKSVVLKGADFIHVANGKIRTVNGYFDSRVIPDQLGLQVIVQPSAIGPFTFGTAVRASVGSQVKPGAFSITALHSRGPEDHEAVANQSRQIATEMLSMPGFISWVGATIGDRMVTITAWEDAEAPRQLLKSGQHVSSVKEFFGVAAIGGGAYTSVMVPARINARWVRCTACQKMVDHGARDGVCTCGAKLPAPIAYW